MWDVFISHASEDKESIAKPIAERLQSAGIGVWLDTQTLALGDSLRKKIDEGLSQSRYGVIILSKHFFAKRWPQRELDGLLAREDVEGRKVLLPVWHDVSAEQVASFAPLLAARLAVSTAEGLDHVADEILSVVRPLPVETSSASIEDIFNRDPFVSLNVAKQLATESKVDWNSVVNRLRGLSPATILSARTFLSRAADRTAPLMTLRIKNAQKDWQAAVLVPDCFHPSHKHYCESEIAELAKGSDDPDVARKAIESLGFLGADGWAWSLLERLKSTGDYFFGKISHSVVLANARMLQLKSREGELPIFFDSSQKYTLDALEQTVRFMSSRGWDGMTFSQLRDVVSLCPVDRADLFLNHWLKSDHPDLRVLACRALGSMRLARTAPHLAGLVNDKSENESVRHEAILALANIGGPVAVRVVSQSGDKFALARCLDSILQEDEFTKVANGLLESDISEKCWVLRAIGLTKRSQFLSVLHESLSDRNPTMRGCAALAIARIEGSNEYGRLEQSHAEAINPMEKILTNLALIVSAGYKVHDHHLQDLRENLKAESYLYHHMTRDDIITELQNCRVEKAQRLAQCWKQVYATMPSY